MAQSAEQAFQRLAEERHEQALREFVEAYRQESQIRGGHDYTLQALPIMPGEREAAIKSGVFDLPNLDVSLNGMVLEHQVNRILSHNKQANDSSGNKYNVCRDRQRRENRRRSGRGFSYRPEIPSLAAGNGGCSGYEWLYEDFDDALFAPRYARKHHPEQSMPKVEWSAVRKWKNKQKQCRKKVAMASRENRRRLEIQRDWIDKHVAEHGTIPQKRGY